MSTKVHLSSQLEAVQKSQLNHCHHAILHKFSLTLVRPDKVCHRYFAASATSMALLVSAAVARRVHHHSRIRHFLPLTNSQ